MRSFSYRASLLLLAACLLGLPAAQANNNAPSKIKLVWHLEHADGSEDSHRADQSLNPASVVKLATSFWALAELGPTHRFETQFLTRGTLDSESGVLTGDLWVIGGGDPDFHLENAQLVADALAAQGITKIDGQLRVSEGFWFGWEGGSERTLTDLTARARMMTKRLRDAWNPANWKASMHNDFADFRERNGAAGQPATRLTVRIGAPLRAAELASLNDDVEPLVVHQSNQLRDILRRFNAYSNNDIERLGHHLGSPGQMAKWLTNRLDEAESDTTGAAAASPDAPIKFETLSGLGVNRLTPRQIVAMLDQLEALLVSNNLSPLDVLPSISCGRSTLRHFPSLISSFPPASLTAKTGTLVQTDGGVVAMAGWLESDQGRAAFFVAAPKNGARIKRGRQSEADWLLSRFSGERLVADSGCPLDPAFSDSEAQIIGR